MSIKQQETRRILNSIPDKNIIIALDENGKMLTSNFFLAKLIIGLWMEEIYVS